MFGRIGRETGPGPFEFGQLPFLFFGGLSTFTHLGVPSSLHSVLGTTVLAIWAGLLTVGSLVGFIGVCWWGKETVAMAIELAGMIALVGVSLIYSVVLLSLIGSVSGLGVVTSFILAIGIQAGGRAGQIIYHQRRLLKLSKILPPEDGE